ncbi:MAG TPA: glycosyltransferase 87 family protein [Microlunatus sp.]|nr:glycosyltransferase 87 family protein [Microlunatus sp.]
MARVTLAGSAPAATTSRRVVSALGVMALPILAALYVGATTFPGGTLLPWHPVMVDLGVYRLAGQTLLAGGDIYNLPGSLPFLYPPFAAVLAVPLALLPQPWVEIGWTVAGALAMVAILHRSGLTGWLLSVVAAATVFLVSPVTQTLAFGQVGIFLVALVFLDLAAGPRALPGRRWLPEGVLTGIAAAVKLTPGLFLVYLLVARKWRAAIACTISGAVVTLLSFAVAPAVSVDFWGRLLRGDTGLGHSLIYYTNQTVYADIVRAFGLGRGPALAGLAASAVVAALGVWAAVVWHRLGDVRFAVVVCGMAGLLASPVSWLHHFVWIVPLAVCLLDRAPAVAMAGGVLRRSQPRIPPWLRVLGLVLVGWVIVAPFQRLPNGADLELTWTWSQHLLASVTALLGVAFLLGCALTGWAALRRLPTVTSPTVSTGSPEVSAAEVVAAAGPLESVEQSDGKKTR